MFDPIKRNDTNNRPLSINGGLAAMTPRATSPRITNMQDRVTDLIADTNAALADLPSYAPERAALTTARVALMQAQRELTTL
ncbi:hypothetical protein [Stenotrophomonas phage BUCTxx99]|nr:hypothetical protein [Stenotrophomonas phage BUCTxx99]